MDTGSLVQTSTSLQPRFQLPRLQDPNSHFRLLKFLPSAPKASIELEVTAVSLAKSKKILYIALSYCWGPEPNPRTILVNQQPYEIRSNLWNFLTELKRSKRLKNRPFFVDAICIDQENIPERNAQVQIMHQIYSGAEEVFCWPGSSTDAIDKLFLLCRDHPAAPPENDKLARRLFADIFIQKLLYVYGEGGFFQFSLGVVSFFELEYWNRVWIVQEILLAKRVVLICGQSSIEFQDMVHLFGREQDWLYDRIILPSLLGDDVVQLMMKHIHRVTNMTNICKWYQNLCLYRMVGKVSSTRPDQELEDSMHISNLIESLEPRICTDARDIVFGLLGIPKALGYEWQSRRRDGAGIEVDYSRSSLFVFFRAMAVQQFTCAVQHALTLRVRLEIEDYLPLFPVPQQIHDDLHMSVDEMHSSTFHALFYRPWRIGDAFSSHCHNVCAPDSVDSPLYTFTVGNIDDHGLDYAFVCTTTGTQPDDYVFSVGEHAVAGLIYRYQTLIEPKVVKQGKIWKLIRPGRLEMECIGLALFKRLPGAVLAERVSCAKTICETHVLPTIFQQLNDLSRLSLGQEVGKRRVVTIDEIDESGKAWLYFGYALSWLDLFCITSEWTMEPLSRTAKTPLLPASPSMWSRKSCTGSFSRLDSRSLGQTRRIQKQGRHGFDMARVIGRT